MAISLPAAPSATAFRGEISRPTRRFHCSASSARLGRPSNQIVGFSTRFTVESARSRSVCSIPATSDALGSKSEVSSEGFTSSLERVEVFDLTGRTISIIDLWRDRKAVVAFARHFGCVLCRKRADLLASQKELMDAAGVALVLIGPGTVEQAKAFLEQTKFKGEVYADPDHSSYGALEFVYGVSSTFTPSAGVKIIQLYMEGYRQDWDLSFKQNTMTRGGWQQGGILVAGPGVGNISYIHKDKEAGDDPDIKDVLKACCSNVLEQA